MPLFFLALTQAYMRSGSLGETVGPMRPMPSASRKAFGELMPVSPPSVDCRVRCRGRRSRRDAPGRTARRPEAGEDDLRVAGIEDEVHAPEFSSL